MNAETEKQIAKIIIRLIKTRHDKTYKKIAESVGVHESYIGKMAKGQRAAKNVVDKLCAVWGIEYGQLLEEIGVSSLSQKFSVSDAIYDILRLKGINLIHLSTASGLPFRDLYALKKGERNATDREIEILSAVLMTAKELLDEGTISSALMIIEEQMERLRLSVEAKEMINYIINQDIKKPLTHV